MKDGILELNGLSMVMLECLSYESKLGIPLKQNLHYFDKESLIAELVEMNNWLHDYLYKKDYPDSLGATLRKLYEAGKIKNKKQFEEAMEDVLLDRS